MPFLGTVSLGNEAVFFISTLGNIGNYWELLGNIGNYWESELRNCCTFAPDFEIQAIVTLIQMISIYPN